MNYLQNQEKKCFICLLEKLCDAREIANVLVNVPASVQSQVLVIAVVLNQIVVIKFYSKA